MRPPTPGRIPLRPDCVYRVSSPSRGMCAARGDVWSEMRVLLGGGGGGNGI